jgi:AcrR family transcriptional regulator
MPRVSAEHLAARRQQILDAALACFDRAGFHRTSMQDIFAESGLSAGAVYRYFASKDDIVEAIAEARHARETELINEAMAVADPRLALHRLADLYFGWLTDPDERQRRRVGVQVWAEAVHHDRLRAVVQRGADQRLLLAGFLNDAQQRGLFLPDAKPEALTRVYLALFQGFILQQAWQPDIEVAPYLHAVHAVIDATMPHLDPGRGGDVAKRKGKG